MVITEWPLARDVSIRSACKGISYHKKCYKDLTNIMHIDRTRARYEKGKIAGSATDIKAKKVGNPCQHLRNIPERTLSTNINVSSAKKVQEVNFMMFQQRTWVHSSRKLVKRQVMKV